MDATLPRLYSPGLLIVRRLKSGTAITVPAVPSAPGGFFFFFWSLSTVKIAHAQTVLLSKDISEITPLPLRILG